MALLQSEAFQSEVFISHFRATHFRATPSATQTPSFATRRKASSGSLAALPVSAGALDGPVGPTPEPANSISRKKSWQASLQQKQLNRNVQQGPSRLLMPPCGAVYQALPQALRPDIEELRTRTGAGEFDGDHRAAMLSMILFQSPSASPQLHPLLPKGATMSLAADGRSKLDVSTWVARLMESMIKEEDPGPTVWPSQEERRVMDSATWSELMKQIVATEMRSDASRRVPRPNSTLSNASSTGATDNGGMDARWLAAAVLTFPGLSKALLQGAPVAESALQLVASWPQLRTLSLVESPLLQGIHLRALDGCSTLSILDVSRCPRLETLAHLPDLSQLKRVLALDCPSLGEVSRSSTAPAALINIKSKAELELQGCPGISRLTMNLPNAVHLDLSFLSGLSDLQGDLRGLQVLDVSYCQMLVDFMPFRACPTLSELSARNCRNLQILRGLCIAPNLKRLRLSGCVNLQRMMIEEDSEEHKGFESARTGEESQVLPSSSMVCPHLGFLDLEHCSSLWESDVISLLRPLYKNVLGSQAETASSVAGDPALHYVMLKPFETMQANEVVQVADFWATEASLAVAREAMAVVTQTADDVTNKESEVAELTSRAEELRAELAEANEQLKGLKGKKLEKAQEVAQAAEAAVNEIEEQIATTTASLEASRQAAAAAPSAARATAKLKFTFRIRSLTTSATCDIPADLDGEVFVPIPMDEAPKQPCGPLVVWPPHLDSNDIESQLEGINLSEIEKDCARLRMMEAIRISKAVTSAGVNDSKRRPEWRERAEEELGSALDSAGRVLAGGLEDFPLLHSSIASGAVELLPETSMTCFLGSKASMKMCDYQMHEVRCAELREPVFVNFAPLSPPGAPQERRRSQPAAEGVTVGVCTSDLEAFQQVLRPAQECASKGDRPGLESAVRDIAALPRIAPASVSLLGEGLRKTAEVQSRKISS